MQSKPRFIALLTSLAAVSIWIMAALILNSNPNASLTVPTQMALDSTTREPATNGARTSSPSYVAPNANYQDDMDLMTDMSAEPVIGQVVIRFASTATDEQRTQYIVSIGGTISENIEQLDTYVVTLPPNMSSLPLPDTDFVTVSEPDYYVSALYSLPTSDTYYADQWALTAIGAPNAWEAVQGSQPLTIAVIDSGVYESHQDLVGRVLNGWDFVQDDSYPQDEFGHGTAIAGILAANIDNGLGIAGVAPNVEILSLRVLDRYGIGTYSDVAAAVVYAVDNGSKVINLSLGGLNPSSVLESAVLYATSHGVIVVAAAGNNGTEGTLYPAAYPEVVAVGSVDSTLERSSFSNYGSAVDLYAPGRDILTTDKDGSYRLVTGTSFAAPHVAGVAALELAQGRSLVINGGVITASSNSSDEGTVVAFEETPEVTPEVTEEPPTPLPAPSDLSATTISTSQISLIWIDNAIGETFFYVERSLNGSTGWQVVATLPADSTTYNDTGLPSATIQYYRVRAFRFSTSQYSAYSNSASAQTLFANPPISITRVSLSSSGAQPTSGQTISTQPTVSADGRYVAFDSAASNIVPNDTNNNWDVLLRDRLTGQTTRISVASNGTQGNNASSQPSMSADGRYIAFTSIATNLISGETLGGVFLHDRDTGETTRLSIFPDSTAPMTHLTDSPTISGDGRYVAFRAWAGMMPVNPHNGYDIYVRDRQTNQTILISKTAAGLSGNGDSEHPEISADGRYISFTSSSTNLVSGDTNNKADVFRYDMHTGQMIRVSLTSGGSQPNDGSRNCAISGDGRIVAFTSFANNLFSGDTGNDEDLFIRNVDSGQTILVTVPMTGVQPNDYTVDVCALSSEGRYIAFESRASNLVTGDTPNTSDTFIGDLSTNQTFLVSLAYTGERANGHSAWVTLASNGHVFIFQSEGTNLVLDDANGLPDIFAYEMPFIAVGVSAPSNLTPTVVSAGEISLTWTDNAPDETSYLIERSIEDGLWIPIGTTGANATSFSDTNVGCGPRVYRVRAQRSGDGRYSAYATSAVSLMVFCPLDAPTNLVAQAVSQTQINLSWTDNSINETSFRIERSLDGTNWTEINSVIENLTTYPDIQAVCGTTYHYRVRGYRSYDTSYSDYSNTVTQMTPLCPPAAPTNLTATSFDFQLIHLTWTDNASDEAAFVIEYSPTGSGNWAEIYTVSANITTYVESGIYGNAIRYYRVRAYRAGDTQYSSYSNPANVTPILPATSVNLSLVSVSSGGVQGIDGISDHPAISSDGRYIAFESGASNLVSGDTNDGHHDIFVRDLQTGQTTRVSVSSSGVEGNEDSSFPSISADGRYIVFHSYASNLIPDDTNGFEDVFLHDRQTGETKRISLSSSGVQSNHASLLPRITPDGHYVVFLSHASNLVSGDTNGVADIFVRDLLTDTTTRVSVSSAGIQSNGESQHPSISADGRYVVFWSYASNLVSADTNGVADAFLRDLQTGQTTRVSVSSNGTQGNAGSYEVRISPDGHYVAFTSEASNLVSNDTNGVQDVFLRSLLTGQVTLISMASNGSQGNQKSFFPGVASGGRFITYGSQATNLVSNDTNGAWDIFMFDRYSGKTIRISETSSGVQANGFSYWPVISDDGRYIAFQSHASNLVPNDLNGSDVFLADVTFAPFVTLAAPSNLNGSPVSSTQISLTWTDNTSDETGFYVERALTNLPVWMEVAALPANSTTFEDSGLTCHTTYSYRVRAYDALTDKFSSASNVVSVTTSLCPPPEEPSAVTPIEVTENKITITWEDNSTDETAVSVERAADSPAQFKQAALLPANQTSFVDKQLVCSRTYYYRTRAYRANDGQFSAYSNTSNVTTSACPPPVPHTAGLYQNGSWLFRDTNTTGVPDVSFNFGLKELGWTPLVGDWDGDGVDGIGLYKDGTWVLRNSASSGQRDLAFTFNPLGTGAMPIVGDWNGDGIDTIGLYKEGMWVLRNSNSAGQRDLAFKFGTADTSWQPISGDWNGDYNDTVGLYKDGKWYLTNKLETTQSAPSFSFGPAQSGWTALAGDWNADGIDTIGLYKDGVWRLRNSNADGVVDVGFTFLNGTTGWKPIAGYRGGMAGLSALGLSEEILPPTLLPEVTESPEVTEAVEPEVSPTEQMTVAPEVTDEITIIVPTPSPTEIPTSVETAPPPSETPSPISTLPPPEETSPPEITESP